MYELAIMFMMNDIDELLIFALSMYFHFYVVVTRFFNLCIILSFLLSLYK